MNKYHVEYTERAFKELRKLDKYTQKLIYSWINKNLEGCSDPREHGKPLLSNRKGQWRYRIGDYRLICIIEDTALVILALSIAHRRSVYE